MASSLPDDSQEYLDVSDVAVFEALQNIVILARELPGAPRCAMKLRQWVHGSVSLRFKIERVINRFWVLQDDSVRICQVTPKITTQKGAEMLAELYKLGIKKECLEFIKRNGLLPGPDKEEAEAEAEGDDL